MNKTTTAAITQKPSANPLPKSAWAKGPPAQPLATQSAAQSRGQSPNGAGTPASTPSHSRKSSTFAPAVKDGVGVSSRITGPGHRTTPSINFGSIDPTTSESSPAPPLVNGTVGTPPPSKDAPVHASAKAFGSVPASTPGASTSSPSTTSMPATATASPTPSNVSAATSSAAPVKRKIDPNKFFQNQSSQPPAGPSSSNAPTSSAPSFPTQPHPNHNASIMASNAANSPRRGFEQLPPPANHPPYYSPQQSNLHIRPPSVAGGPTAPRSPSFSRNQMPINGVTPGPNGPGANGAPGPSRTPSHGGQPQVQPGNGQIGSPRIGGQPPLPMVHPQQPQQQPGAPVPQPGQMPNQPTYPQQMPPQGWQPPYGWQPYSYQQYPHMMPPDQQWYPPHMHPHMPHMHPQAPYMQSPTTPMQPFPTQPGPPTQQPQQNNGLHMSPRTGPVPALAPQSTGSAPPATVNTNVPPAHQTPTASLTPLTARAREFVPGGGSPVVTSPGFPLPPKKSGIRLVNPTTGEPVVLRPPDAPGGHQRTISQEINVGSPLKKTPIRLESEAAKNKRIAEEAAAKQKEKEAAEAKEKEKKRLEDEAAEKERKAKEEADAEVKRKADEAARLKREEEERVKKAEADRIQKEKEDAERKQREAEEAEQRKRDEEERVRKAKEDDERKQREAEEAAVKAKADEAERLRKETEAAKAKEEAEAAAKAAAPSLLTPPISANGSAATSPKATPAVLPSKPTLAPITTDKPRLQRPVPGPLDLSSTHKPGLAQPLPSALASARRIEDLDAITYPEGIKTPDIELNQGQTKGGKFKYDRDFLMQFMSLCKDKPDNLSALDSLGIERGEGDGAANFGSTGRGQARRGLGSMGPPTGGRSASVGLGLGMNFPTSKSQNPFAAGMGSFQAPSRMTSEDRFAASNRAVSATFPARPTQMSRTTSQGGVGGPALGPNAVPPSPGGRSRSQRGRQRNDSLKPNHAAAPPQQSQYFGANQGGFLEPVAPLQATENRWTPNSLARKAPTETEHAVVERKLKGLLNKLTLEKFDSISDQIIAWANKSENETNGQTLIHVIKLVFEKATDEATFSEMYARLCRKMMETISQKVQDESIKNANGEPIVGGHLFRKYLLNRCQEDFEKGWSAKESAAAAAALKAADDKAAAEATAGQDGEVALYSDEYYAALKAKRQGLGLVKFIGELFKLQMLTERIMHECIKKLLSKIEDPEEEEIESLCKLLTTVGQSLDTVKAKNHMDIYFQRMDVLSKNPMVASRVRYMLLDVIDLRSRGWQHRQAVAAPQTIAQVHAQAAKEKADAETAKASQQYNRLAMGRTGSQRGGARGDFNQPGPDGWNVAGNSAPRPPAKAGDLSNFGKFTNKVGGPLASMGPSSVFKKSERGRDTPPPGAGPPISRASSSANMFSMLAGGEVPADITMQRTPSGRGSARKPSADMTATGVPDTPVRKKLQLLPRSVPSTAEKEDGEVGEDGDADAEASESAPAAPSMTEEQAKTKIDEDLKEFWSIRDIDEGVRSFEALPDEFKGKFVDKLVGKAMDSKEADVKVVAELFSRAADSGACPASAFESGIAGTIEFLDDMAIDIPQAYPLMARLLRGSKLPQESVEALADKIFVDGDPVQKPKDKLLKEYAALA